jgi:hypothetical protein
MLFCGVNMTGNIMIWLDSLRDSMAFAQTCAFLVDQSVSLRGRASDGG